MNCFASWPWPAFFASDEKELKWTFGINTDTFVPTVRFAVNRMGVADPTSGVVCLVGSGFDHIMDNTSSGIYYYYKDAERNRADCYTHWAFHFRRLRT
jgi:hypothetical protein